jgi:Outer membrane protein beta-barrel domain
MAVTGHIQSAFGRFSMKTLCVVALLACIVLPAAAQQFDAAFGLGGVSSTSAANASGNYFPQSIGGGVFPGFSADYLFHRRMGIEGEIFWRAGQNLYAGYQPFRPIFWDFNGIWAPTVSSRFSPELLAGIGSSTVRFYQPYLVCSAFVGCTNYTSESHFMGDLGGGLRLYATHNIFVRPEARLYLIHNNFLFSSGHATRYGVSIGYSFGER